MHRTSFGAVQVRINSTLYYTVSTGSTRRLKDHLGSASVVTNASGTILGENRYYPFGETRLTTGTIFTDKLFTGQREMAGLDIYHYGARFYSPKLGRFLSPDTIVPGAANPQAYNRYSYVLNNPVLYTDPTGHAQSCEDGDVCTSGGSGTSSTLIEFTADSGEEWTEQEKKSYFQWSRCD
ncbi:MAG: RHS repeat-associated core domain-containing protein [Anaerolineales bacterium]